MESIESCNGDISVLAGDTFPCESQDRHDASVSLQALDGGELDGSEREQSNFDDSKSAAFDVDELEGTESDEAGIEEGLESEEFASDDYEDIVSEWLSEEDLDGCSATEGRPLQEEKQQREQELQRVTALRLRLPKSSLDVCTYDRDALQDVDDFLRRCRVGEPDQARRKPASRLPKDTKCVEDLEIDSGDYSLFSFWGLRRRFPVLKSLLYKTTDCLRVVYDLRGLAVCRGLRSLKLELSFQTMCENELSECGVTALAPLAGTLEVLEIGRLRFNCASDLKVLEMFEQLRVLKYTGINELPEAALEADSQPQAGADKKRSIVGAGSPSRDLDVASREQPEPVEGKSRLEVELEAGSQGMELDPSVLNLSALTRLEELEFIECSFTAPAGTRNLDLGDDDPTSSDDEKAQFGFPEHAYQALIPPAQLRNVTFRHQYSSRITPELRRFLESRGCKTTEYVPRGMAGSGTLNFVDGWMPQTGKGVEATERMKKEERRAAREERLKKAMSTVPGMNPSSIEDFQVGESVYVFCVHLRFFREAVIGAEPRRGGRFPVKFKSVGGDGRDGLSLPEAGHEQASCLFREPPVPVRKARGPFGEEVWRPGCSDPPRAKRPRVDEEAPLPSTFVCETCGKRLKTPEGRLQHIMAKHRSAGA